MLNRYEESRGRRNSSRLRDLVRGLGFWDPLPRMIPQAIGASSKFFDGAVVPVDNSVAARTIRSMWATISGYSGGRRP
jgi:hypothetical protein